MIKTTQVKATKRGIRIWQEGKALAEHGFHRGLPYTRSIDNGVITMALGRIGCGKTLTVAGRSRNGKDLPIIDISATSIDGFPIGSTVQVTYSASLIKMVCI